MNLPKSLERDVLKRCGLYITNLKKSCITCLGDGIIVDRDNHEAFDCPSCVKVFKKNKIFLMANIPIEYLNIEIRELQDHYDPMFYDNYMKLYDNAEEILSRTAVIFHRFDEEKSYGVSTAGVMLMKKYIRSGYSGMYCDINSFFSNLNTWSDSEEVNESRMEMIEYYKNVDFLVVDNLGTEISKNYGENYFYKSFVSILAERKNKNKINIICTDLSMDSFKKKYEGEVARIVDKNFIAVKIHTKKEKDQSNVIADLNKKFGIESFKYTGVKSTINLKKKNEIKDDDKLSRIK